MKRKVSRVEAIIIMKAAKEFREKQSHASIVIPEPVAEEPDNSSMVSKPIVENKPNFLIHLINLFRRKGT